MLEFYYDFLDRYFSRRDFELIQMDKDSNFLAISADRLEDIVCPQCYYVDEQDSEKKKLSTNGMWKSQNLITWQRFKAAFEGCTDRAENRGFRMRGVG